MHEVGKKEMVQGYYSGNLGGAVVLKCVSILRERGSVNLDDFWNQSSNHCWNFFEMSGFFKDNSLSTLLQVIFYIEFCTKS